MTTRMATLGTVKAMDIPTLREWTWIPTHIGRKIITSNLHQTIGKIIVRTADFVAVADGVVPDQ